MPVRQARQLPLPALGAGRGSRPSSPQHRCYLTRIACQFFGERKGAGMSQELLYQVDEAIATITFNRPERMNALTHELEAELHRRLDEADADRSVRVIILTGAGRAFCSGYDQGAVGKSGTRHSDPTGKSHAEFLEHWQRIDGLRV